MAAIILLAFQDIDSNSFFSRILILQTFGRRGNGCTELAIGVCFKHKVAQHLMDSCADEGFTDSGRSFDNHVFEFLIGQRIYGFNNTFHLAGVGVVIWKISFGQFLDFFYRYSSAKSIQRSGMLVKCCHLISPLGVSV